ncbi:MAG: acyl-CoA synthetase [Deltaproteobacteria bacterium]|nr:acyl-CoA synthetase [Deltaproteobacteria bacterium]
MHPGDIARRTPDKAAYVFADSGEAVSYAQLYQRSNQGAQLLRKLGLRTGDGIAVMMENHPRFFEICWAAQCSGLHYTTISSRLTAPEVEYIVRDCGARVFITSAAKAEIAEALAATLADLDALYMVDGQRAGFASWEDASNAQPQEPISDPCEGSDLLYSSGTTGRPKGIKFPGIGRPLGKPSAIVSRLTDLYGATDRDVYLSPAPLYHAAPLRFAMGFQRIGATAVIMQEFDALEALALIERHRITISQWVPSMFVRMLKLPEDARAHFDLSSQRAAVHAAAPCPIPVKRAMLDWWGPVLYEYYGGTEANGFVSIDTEQWLAHPGSVGRAVRGTLHILDDEGRELPPGEQGGVYFEKGGRFEYHNAPEKTASSQTAAGWSTLGDIGYLDDEGYLYLTDRKANVINSGGVNIYPQEAENTLISHPKVADVAVFGVPSEDFGEEVKAVVQPLDMADAGPALERELIAYCHGQLAKFKCPRSVDFEVELPRHPTGKLYKRLLKDRYWGQHGSRIV